MEDDLSYSNSIDLNVNFIPNTLTATFIILYDHIFLHHGSQSLGGKFGR